MKKRYRIDNEKTLGAYSAPVIQQSGIEVTTDGQSGEIHRNGQKIPIHLKGETDDNSKYIDYLKKLSENIRDTTDTSTLSFDYMSSTVGIDEDEYGDYEYNS